MTRNPKLDKLKTRRTSEQQFARRERMMKRGTFRQQTEMDIAKLIGQNKTAFQGLVHTFGHSKLTRYGVYGIVTERVLDYGYRAAQYFGWL